MVLGNVVLAEKGVSNKYPPECFWVSHQRWVCLSRLSKQEVSESADHQGLGMEDLTMLGLEYASAYLITT